MSDRSEHEARRGIKKTRGERVELVERTTTKDSARGSRKGANALLDLSDLGFNPHYLGPTYYRADIAYTNDKCDAVAVFRPPISAAFNKALPGCLELSRLWRDDWRKAQTSYFLLACLRSLRELKPSCPCVVAYTDPSATDTRTGNPHTGTVYRYSNFVHIGSAPAAEPHWLDETGARINRQRVVRMLGTGARERVAALRPDWTYVAGQPKLIFMYPMAMTVDDAVATLEAQPRSARTRPFKLSARGAVDR